MPLFDHIFETRITRSVELPYLLHKTPSPAPSAGYPLLLFLHGSGERGTDLSRLRQHSLPRLLDEGLDFPGVVVMPQCPHNHIWSHILDELVALVAQMQAEYAIDPNRVYLMGLSMGGAGVWELAMHAPELFAGLVAICPPNLWIFNYPDQLGQASHIAAWQLHGELDPVVPVEDSHELVSVFRALGGDIRLTLYPNTDHDAWTPALQEPDLWPWLLSLSRQSAEKR